jgi:hypothetical protein
MVKNSRFNNNLIRKIVFFISLICFFIPVFSQQLIDIEVNYDQTALVSSFSAGVTHTQYSLDSWNNSIAISAAKILLENSTSFQNQHIMGWGCLNPWPDSSVINSAGWNWNSLDDRINLMRETKGEAIITLCGCPTWMHTPAGNGTTEWGSALEKAPTPVHFDDFAHLCAEVARRYPDVMYYQVWNELKGFWSLALNRWRYEDYTIMYNMIYDSLKAVNPAIKVGGPYPVMSTYSEQKSYTIDLGVPYGYYDKRALDVIPYWLGHKKGADFLAVDGGIENKDDISICEVFKAGDKFADIVSWIRQQLIEEPSLDIWWSEWYALPGNTDPQNNIEFDNALMASSLIKTIKAGSSSVLIWQPEGNNQGFAYPLGLWTSTVNSDGGKPTPFYYTLKILKDHFSKGVEIVNSTTSSDDVTVMASKKKILIVNHKNINLEIRINNSFTISILPYEVKLIDTGLTEIQQLKDADIKINFNNDSGILSLQTLNSTPVNINYSIFNQSGSVIKLRKEKLLSEHNINLSMIPSGIYFYRIYYMNNLYNGHFVRTR